GAAARAVDQTDCCATAPANTMALLWIDVGTRHIGRRGALDVRALDVRPDYETAAVRVVAGFERDCRERIFTALFEQLLQAVEDDAHFGRRVVMGMRGEKRRLLDEGIAQYGMVMSGI